MQDKAMDVQGGNPRSGVHNVPTWKVVNRQLKQAARKLVSAHKLPADIPQAKEMLIFKEQLDQETERAEQEVDVSLRDIKQAVMSVRNQLDNLEEGEAFVLQLQELMTTVQRQLNDFKASQRQSFQQLQQEEEVLERELDMFQHRLDSDAWNESIMAPKAPATAAPACSAAKKGSQGLLPEVIDFDAYEEEYDTEGNWHSDDHKEFLRILRSYKGDYAATVLECSERMVGFDRMDILAHARWHSQYEELAIRKKVAIQAWRQRRQEEARAQREHAEDAVEGWQGPQSCNKKGKHEEVERKYTKAVIAEWRACKEQEAEEERRAHEAAKQAKAAQEAAKRSARQQEIAAQREARRAAEAEAAARVAQRAQHVVPAGFHESARPWTAGAQRVAGGAGVPAAAPGARPLTADKKQVLQERNRQFLEKRAAAVRAKKEQQSMRATRQAQMAAKVHVHGIPDRTRLFQATASTANRLAAEKENEHVAKDSGFIRHVPHKAPPRLPI